MSVPVGYCLQCRESREAVKANKLICATISGYEYQEVDQEWEKHHWRDWSDNELAGYGLNPDQFDAHRRTSSDDLEWPARDAWCANEGHFRPNPEYMTDHHCPGCYADLKKLEDAGHEIKFRELTNDSTE